jgi:surface antigen
VILRRLSLSATLVALAAVLGSLLVGVPRAEASSTLLCQKFAPCTRAGYANFGYNANYTKMWWRMYAGHNCTNYVAYRMVSRGMSATRPWSGSGDARNWGVVFKEKTNQTPMVGSVAWWSTNHVAYVEQIIDANTIVVSEDHYGGQFDWRKIVRSGGGWPTGFIHLNDEAMAATAAPGIAGVAQVDTPLSANAGGWNLAGATFGYQWLANGAAIPGATGPTYVPTPQQVSVRFSVKVTATKPGYRGASSVSAATAPTAPGTMRTTTTPTVTGVAKVGGVLTATGGSWTPEASSASLQWFADGQPIPGATQPTLALGPAQLGRRITAVLTGRRAGYTDGAAGSAPTAPVGPENLVMTQEPVLAGDPHVGRTLVVTPGAVGPDGVVTAYRWMRNGARIPGAHDARYVPAAADLGARLSLRVRYSRPGYNSIVRTLSLAETVQTYPGIYVSSPGHRRLTIRLRAAGLNEVKGKVTLVNARGVRRTHALRNGQVTFAPDWLYAGRRTVTVIYEGSPRVDGRTITKTLRVR